VRDDNVRRRANFDRPNRLKNTRAFRDTSTVFPVRRFAATHYLAPVVRRTTSFVPLWRRENDTLGVKNTNRFRDNRSGFTTRAWSRKLRELLRHWSAGRLVVIRTLDTPPVHTRAVLYRERERATIALSRQRLVSVGHTLIRFTFRSPDSVGRPNE